jgi:hypothetical protein
MKTPVGAWFLMDYIVEEANDKKYLINAIECEWRTVLKDAGIEISTILTEIEQPKKKKTRLDIDPPTSSKLLPHVIVVASPGECNTYFLDSQDKERRKEVMDILRNVHNKDEHGPAIADYLLKRLGGIFEEDDIPEDCQEVKEAYDKIAPLDGEWVVFEENDIATAHPSASTTVISRPWG